MVIVSHQFLGLVPFQTAFLWLVNGWLLTTSYNPPPLVTQDIGQNFPTAQNEAANRNGETSYQSSERPCPTPPKHHGESLSEKRGRFFSSVIWGGLSFLGESWLYEIGFWRNYIFIGFNKYSNDRSGKMVSPWKAGRFKVFQKCHMLSTSWMRLDFRKLQETRKEHTQKAPQNTNMNERISKT